MKKILILLLCANLCACSSMKKSVLYGGLSGATIGAFGGGTLSPDKESIAPNMAVWGSIGAIIGAGLGYVFYSDDPENKELPNMILPKNKEDYPPLRKFEAVNIVPSETKKYKVETGPIPEHLKSKVKAPFILEHQIPERVEQMENGKTMTIESHKAWEYTYE